MILNISHLVVNGCSYTYGHGIEDPVSNAWPSLVAKKLGVPLVNLAVPGQSNYAVQRRTYNYFFRDLYNDNNPLYIHAYTQSQRREVYLAKDHTNRPYQDYVLVDSSNYGKITNLEKEVILETDDYCFKILEERKLHIWHSINSLLDKYNVPHFSTDYMRTTDGGVKEWVNKYHFILKAELDTHPNRLRDFNDLTEKLQKTSCNHETEEGHALLADYVYEQITKRYSDINVIDKPYAKLKDTYIEPPSVTNDRIETNNQGHPLYYLHREWGGNIYYMEELGVDWTKVDWMGRPDRGIKP